MALDDRSRLVARAALERRLDLRLFPREDLHSAEGSTPRPAIRCLAEAHLDTIAPALTHLGTKPSLPCRLCGGETVPLFQRDVLGKHNVTYHQCTGCGLTQTDEPTGLS